MFLARIYNDLSTIYSKDVNNESNVYLAKRLLNKSLKMLKNKQANKLEICILQNLSAVHNRLENYNESLKYINAAYEKIGSGN